MNDSSVVYVLGAGMSVGAGIPVMAGLTKVVLSETYMQGAASDLGRFCSFAFPGYGVLSQGMVADEDGAVFAGDRFAMNIEQFMAAIDAFRVYSDVTGTWKGLTISPERVFPLFMSTLAQAIRDLSPTELPEYYRRFASRLRPGDSIITFNWDCLAERACDDAGVRWSYPQLIERGGKVGAGVDYDTVVIFKMHGSIDWFEYREGLPPNRVLHLRDDKPIVVQSHTPPRKEKVTYTSRGQVMVEPAEIPCLIPPSHFKTFPTAGIPGLLWTGAHRFLVNARKLVVIGYSLPLTDYLPRWLFRLGVLWNTTTGENLVREYSGCPPEEEILAHLGVADISKHLDELRMQGLLHDPYLIRDFWDRAALPITVIDPNPDTGEHYRRLVGYNIIHEQCTAEEYLGRDSHR